MGARQPTPSERPASNAVGDSAAANLQLISVAALDRLLRSDGERLTVLDVRWELGSGARRDLFAAGHIPGAGFVDLDTSLAAPPGAGGRHPLPAAASFQADMRAVGVCDGRGVVVYDAANSMSAARAWWLLRYFGHRQVAVLDGGIAAWLDAGLPAEVGAGRSAGSDTSVAGDFTARPGAMAVLDAAGAAGLARRGVLIDARAPERFRGETEPVDPVAGHIPGARNRPTTLNVEASGRFLGREPLQAAFAELGLDAETDVGAYCGSGVTAAHEVLALELAGYEAALYPGSWSEWITDPERPVATGPASTE